jgi:deoxycytidylate deaminase
MPTLPISIRLLREIASQSDHNSYLHVAVVTRGGVLLAVECNQGSHHAECRTLEKLWPSERKGTTVYSLRFTMGHKRLALAKPCSECEAYMRRYGVKKVVYSTTGGELVSFRLR